MTHVEDLDEFRRRRAVHVEPAPHQQPWTTVTHSIPLRSAERPCVADVSVLGVTWAIGGRSPDALTLIARSEARVLGVYRDVFPDWAPRPPEGWADRVRAMLKDGTL